MRCGDILLYLYKIPKYNRNYEKTCFCSCNSLRSDVVLRG